jgi:PAS domain S-box-containing protein/putative nucleotidyltransferase with HDIG domain
MRKIRGIEPVGGAPFKKHVVRMNEQNNLENSELAGEIEELRLKVKELRSLKDQCGMAKAQVEGERNRAQLYLDIAGVILLVLDTKGRIKVANKRASEILGYSQDELITMDWFSNFIPADNRSTVKKIFRDMISGKNNQPGNYNYFENSILTKNGEERVIVWQNTVIRDAAGKVTATLNSGEDVTERKRLEEARIQNLGFYRSLVKASPDAIFLFSSDARLIMVNQRAADLFGFKHKEEAIGRDIFEFIDAADIQRARNNMKQLVKKGSILETEYVLRRVDGSAFTGEVNSTAVRGPDGRIQALMGVVRDVTEKKLAENALRESEKRFRDIFEHSSDGVLVVDPQTGRFYDSNRMISNMLGFTHDELITMAIDDIHPGEDLTYIKEQFKARPGRRVDQADDIPVKRKDGTLFYASVNSYPITISGREYMIGIFRDTSKIKEAEIQANAARLSAEKANAAISSIVRASALFLGQEFFDAVTKAINETLGARYTFIAVIDQKLPNIAKTISFCVDGKISDNFEYAIAGTPGEQILQGDCFLCVQEVWRKFPDDETLKEWGIEGYLGVPLRNARKEVTGLLVSLYSRPIEDSQFVKSVHEMFAYRVSGELERERNEEVIRESLVRERTLEALRDSRDYLDKVINVAADPIFVKNREHEWVLLNDAYCKFIGYPREELIGKSDYDYFPKRQADVFWNRDEIVFETGKANVNEEEFTDSSGKVHIIVTKKTLHVDNKGEKFIVGVIRDITEQKETARALRESEEKFRKVTSSADDAIMIFDAETKRFIEVNKSCEKMYGYSRQEFDKLTILDISAEPHSSQRAIEQILLGDTTRISHRNHKKKNGELFPVEVTASAFTISGRDVVGAIVRDISERKRLEEERLRHERLKVEMAERAKAEKVLRLTQFSVDKAVESIYWVDKEGRFQYVNEQACFSLGYSQEQLLAMNVFDIDPGFSTKLWPRHWQKLKKEKSFTFETTHKRSDGKTFPVEITVNYLEADGKEYNCALAHNISERKESQEKIRRSHEFLTKIIDSLTYPFYVIDAKNYTIKMANESGRLANFKNSITCHEAIHQRPSPCDGKDHPCPLQKVKKSKLPFHVEHTHYDNEGRRRLVEVHAYPVIGENGDVSEIIEYCLDITARKKIENSLRESEAAFSSVLQALPAGLFIYEFQSPDTLRPLTANPAAARLTGKDLEEIKGKTFDEIWPKAREAGITEKFLQVAFSGKLCFFEKLEYKDSFIDGIFSVNVFPVPGGRLGVVFENITEREKAQQTLLYTKFFVDHMNDIGLWIDSSGGIFYANEAAREKLGFSRRELYKMKIYEIDTNFPADLWVSQWEEIRRKKTTIIETQFKPKHGEAFPVEISGTFMEYNDKEYLCAIARDLTERERAEEALRQSEQEKTMILDTLSELVVYHDKNMRILWANKTARCDLKSSRQQLIGSHCFAAWHNKKRPCRNCPVHASLKSGKFQQGEIFSPDGTCWHIRAYPIKDKSGALTGVVEVGLNISQQRKAEQDSRLNLERSQRILEETVVALAATAERRDPYTAGHQRRVAQLACAIAAELGLDKEIIEGVRMAAIIHDVGKVYVPSEILSKPSKLTDLEMSIIKTHPQIGYEILEPVEFPWPVALIVLQHHERLDGSGYPLGISGNDILYEAKILAIADVVEAMASHRPYRAAIGVTEALKEIVQNKGILYEAKAVEACVKLFKKKKFTFE